ncbi:MAG: alpha/beta hydrolase [Armatimonadetes bacterium]|nr:alpha/beta hydrolase [Armatimonadota bacterium]
MDRREAEFPPAGRFLAAGEARLHYAEEGAGPPVVFVHGIAGTLHDFSLVMPLVARERRALAFDRPGHGYSTRPGGEPATAEVQARWLRAALAAQGVARPVVVGHSWGGALALSYTLQFPEEVAGLVLVASVAYPLRGYGPLLALARLLCAPVAGNVLLSTLAAPLGPVAAGRLLEAAFSPDAVLPGVAPRAAALWTRPAAARAAAEDGITLARSLRAMRPRYPTIRVPVHIVVGEEDRIVNPAEHSYPLRHAIGHSRLTRLARAGHAIPWTHPEVVAEAIRSLAQDSPAGNRR